MAVFGGMSCPFPQTQVPDPHPYTIGAGGTSQETWVQEKGNAGRRTQQPRAPSEGRQRQNKRGERERTEEKTRERREGKKRQTERQTRSEKLNGLSYGLSRHGHGEKERQDGGDRNTLRVACHKEVYFQKLKLMRNKPL